MNERRQVIPIIYVRGSHYQCGFEVGRTFSSLIKTFLVTSKQLNENFLPAYNTAEGKRVYDETLSLVTEKFPEYVDEIKGTADGAEVEFFKLMLFHFDEIIPNVTNQRNSEIESSGCSTIYVKNSENHLLGHTEDAEADCLNNFYIVNAHVESNGKFQEEKFSSLCYPGHIGGYTFNFNCHGLIFSINTLVARTLLPNKIPRHFITRKLLSARNESEALDILKNSNLADAFSINLIFQNNFHNIEMGPAINGTSQMSSVEVKEGSNIHCNHFLRLNIQEPNDFYLEATKTRYKTLQNFLEPKNKEDIINMLGDVSHAKHYIFRCQQNAPTKTICVGIFDLKNKTWSLYKDNPKHNEPLVTLPMNI